MERREKGRVCVTGAAGFVASWTVKLLLSEGYIVHGTVRNPDDEKNSHLKKLDKASENLQLFKADMLDYDSVYKAIEGCDGVFHVASPVPFGSVPNPEVDLIEPAVRGTLNVLKASSEMKLKRVVCVSSGASVMMNPNWPKDRVMDEHCWSDKQYCSTTENWYFLAKTVAEEEALQYGEQNGLDVVSVCPSLILGPLLQPTVNATSLLLIKILKGEIETMENKARVIVDVRDVAEALILAYEKSKASGRYICGVHHIRTRDLVEKLKSIYPNCNYPENFTEVDKDLQLSSEKLKSLGWKYRPLEETLADTVKYCQEAGYLGRE